MQKLSVLIFLVLFSAMTAGFAVTSQPLPENEDGDSIFPVLKNTQPANYTIGIQNNGNESLNVRIEAVSDLEVQPGIREVTVAPGQNTANTDQFDFQVNLPEDAEVGGSYPLEFRISQVEGNQSNESIGLEVGYTKDLQVEVRRLEVRKFKVEKNRFFAPAQFNVSAEIYNPSSLDVQTQVETSVGENSEEERVEISSQDSVEISRNAEVGSMGIKKVKVMDTSQSSFVAPSKQVSAALILLLILGAAGVFIYFLRGEKSD